MESICKETLCTGCSACLNICPKGAIRMVEKEPLGFIYPSIDNDLCINCHLCVNVCPVNSPVEKEYPKECYAVVSKDEADLMSSASGGASSLLASFVLKQGGVVYGCVQKNYKDIAHRRIDKEEDAFLLKGSKYVQSNINRVYKDVKKDLQNGLFVLFTGTPCQIGGLRSFLHQEYENLLLVDLVCHGVPSQKLLQEDVDSILTGYKKSVKNIKVEFRHKTQDAYYHSIWGSYIQFGCFLYDSLNQKNICYNTKRQLFLKNNYITAFMAGTIFRDNCYQCQYATSHRCSDITIADYWGLGKSSVPSGNGVSLMLCNTQKSLSIVNSIKKFALIEQRPIEEAIRGNEQLQKPSPKPIEREIFFHHYKEDVSQAYHLSLKNYRTTYKTRILYNKYNYFMCHTKGMWRVEHLFPFTKRIAGRIISIIAKK